MDYLQREAAPSPHSCALFSNVFIVLHNDPDEERVDNPAQQRNARHRKEEHAQDFLRFRPLALAQDLVRSVALHRHITLDCEGRPTNDGSDGSSQTEGPKKK